MKINDKSLIGVLFFTCILGALYFYGFGLKIKEETVVKNQIAQIPNFFKDINIAAASAIVRDGESGEIIFMRHPYKKMPIASITKLASTEIILENLEETDKVGVPSIALSQVGDNGLLSGEYWIVGDLLKFSLVGSSNDGMTTLVLETEKKSGKNFTDIMDEKMKELGFTSFSFGNATGLDDENKLPATFGSASDVGTLMYFVYKKYPNILQSTKEKTLELFSIDGFPHEIANTNTFTDLIPDLVASKTGYTEASGGNLVILVNPIPGRFLEIVVLGSTYTGRFEDILTLAQKSKEYMQYLEANKLLNYFPFSPQIR